MFGLMVGGWSLGAGWILGVQSLEGGEIYRLG